MADVSRQNSTLQISYLILTIILGYLTLYQYISIQNNYTIASFPLTLMIIFVSIVFGRLTVDSDRLIENKSDDSYEEEEEEENKNDNENVTNPTGLTETVRSRVNSSASMPPDAELEGLRDLVQRFNTPQLDTDTNTNMNALEVSDDDDTIEVKHTLNRLIDQLPS